MDNTAMTKSLIKVQQHVLKAAKDGTNTFFGGSKYATLDSVLEAVRGPLTENGFALVQDATTGEMSVSVVTRLLHESGGELVSPPLSAPLKKEFTKTGVELPPSVQQIGSLVTYLRRYSLCPFLGVALDDDDDGNMASQIGKTEDGGQKTEVGGQRTESSEKRLTSPQQTGAGHAQARTDTDRHGQRTTPDGATTNGQAGAGSRKSAYTGEALNTPEAVERHKAAAGGERGAGAVGNGQSATREGAVSRKDAKAQSGEGETAVGGQRSEGEAPHPSAVLGSGGATTNGGGRGSRQSAVGSGQVGDGGKTGKTLPVPPPDVMAFNTRLYDAMERDKISEAEITGYLNGTYGKPRIARPVLAGNMTIHNLGERIADALVSGTDKDGKSNWETVVGRIRVGRG